MMTIEFPIKFRGKRVKTGELVYGDVAYTEVGVLIGAGFEVEPKSVKQLAGYDSDGNEVYAGDELVDDDGREWKARILANAVSTLPLWEGVSHDINTLKLKGNAK